MDQTAMTVREQFLIKEYETGAQLTFHIDELRDRIVKFFLSVGGIGGGALLVLLKGDVGTPAPLPPEGVVAGLSFIAAVLGAIVVYVLAHLRRVQIERFRIMNNIRRYFLGNELTLWNVVELSIETMPKRTRRSGTYAYVGAIMLTTSVFFGLSVLLATTALMGEALDLIALLGGPLALLLSICGLDWSYWQVADPCPRVPYVEVPGTNSTACTGS